MLAVTYTPCCHKRMMCFAFYFVPVFICSSIAVSSSLFRCVLFVFCVFVLLSYFFNSKSCEQQLQQKTGFIFFQSVVFFCVAMLKKMCIVNSTVVAAVAKCGDPSSSGADEDEESRCVFSIFVSMSCFVFFL